MMLLSSHLIILHAILQNILYIHQPYNSKEVYACFDTNGQKNDSWPSNWVRMISYAAYDIPILIASMPNDTIQYKLRIKFLDNNMGDIDWKILNNTCTTTTPTAPSLEPVAESVSGLLYYITVCTSLLIVKSIVRIVQKNIQVGKNVAVLQ